MTLKMVFPKKVIICCLAALLCVQVNGVNVHGRHLEKRQVDYTYSSLGCYQDRQIRAIPTLEGTDPRLDGGYRSRVNAIEKCAEVARDLGYECFALQDGGWCASSATACDTYDIYGPSTACLNDGEGGAFANEVYRFDEPNGEVRRDPHLTSFDGRHFDFQGICWYTIATVCSKDDTPFFEITGLFEPRMHSPGLEIKTRTVTVVVTYAGESVTLNKDNTVITNGSPEMTEASKLEITHTMDAVIVRTRGVGLTVIWKGQEHTVNIKLDDNRYHGQTCGLLGNNDGNPKNDFIMKDGSSTDDIHEFGDSWKVTGKSC